ncbi:MAG: site-specific integrase [Spirochaetes bacterium]|nr:site-specific integrase [Spirochaetota bacterium]
MNRRARRPFIIYKRTSGLKRGSYYAGFLDQRTGIYPERMALYDANGQPVMSKLIADELARKIHEEGVPGTAEGFGDLLASFWAHDGMYVRDKRDQGEALSLAYQENNYNNVRKHIVPYLKKHGDPSVDRVTAELLKSILRAVGDKGLKGRTVNTVRQTFAVPLRAYWEGKLHPERNPCTARLVPHFDDTPAERQLLTLAEARAFFKLRFEDPRLYAIHRQGAFTGMRLGECIGMHHGDLTPEMVKTGRTSITEYWIDVRHNWQEREGVKGPKKGSFGKVPVPAAIAQMLLALEKKNPFGGPFLYWGFTEKRPLPKKDVERSFNEACARIGISAAERKRRGLGFHAWRHWYDTYMHIDPVVMQKLMRHRTAEMTTHYKHLTDEQRRGAYGAAAGLLGMVSPEKKRKKR